MVVCIYIYIYIDIMYIGIYVWWHRRIYLGAVYRCIGARCYLYVAAKHSAVWMGIGLDIFNRLAVYVYGLPFFLLIAFYMCWCRLDAIRLVAMVGLAY